MADPLSITASIIGLVSVVVDVLGSTGRKGGWIPIPHDGRGFLHVFDVPGLGGDESEVQTDISETRYTQFELLAKVNKLPSQGPGVLRFYISEQHMFDHDTIPMLVGFSGPNEEFRPSAPSFTRLRLQWAKTRNPIFRHRNPSNLHRSSQKLHSTMHPTG
jgi:hypothetical protein